MVHYPINPKLRTNLNYRALPPFPPLEWERSLCWLSMLYVLPPVHHLVILAVTSTVMVPQCLYCNPCIVPCGSCHQLLLYHAFPPEHWKHPPCKKFWERERPHSHNFYYSKFKYYSILSWIVINILFCLSYKLNPIIGMCVTGQNNTEYTGLSTIQGFRGALERCGKWSTWLVLIILTPARITWEGSLSEGVSRLGGYICGELYWLLRREVVGSPIP